MKQIRKFDLKSHSSPHEFSSRIPSLIRRLCGYCFSKTSSTRQWLKKLDFAYGVLNFWSPRRRKTESFAVRNQLKSEPAEKDFEKLFSGDGAGRLICQQFEKAQEKVDSACHCERINTETAISRGWFTTCLKGWARETVDYPFKSTVTPSAAPSSWSSFFSKSERSSGISRKPEDRQYSGSQ